jgi:hypothetical protein
LRKLPEVTSSIPVPSRPFRKVKDAGRWFFERRDGGRKEEVDLGKVKGSWKALYK